MYNKFQFQLTTYNISSFSANFEKHIIDLLMSINKTQFLLEKKQKKKAKQ